MKLEPLGVVLMLAGAAGLVATTYLATIIDFKKFVRIGTIVALSTTAIASMLMIAIALTEYIR